MGYQPNIEMVSTAATLKKKRPTRIMRILTDRASIGTTTLPQLDLKVREAMRPSPLTIPAEATIDAAARVMDRRERSCLLVKSKSKIVGIVTERDIVRRVAAKRAPLRRTKVSSIMTSPIIAITSSATLEEALRVMAANKVRRLPVVDKAKLVGLVTVGDIARALAEKTGYTNELIAALTRGSKPLKGIYV